MLYAAQRPLSPPPSKVCWSMKKEKSLKSLCEFHICKDYDGLLKGRISREPFRLEKADENTSGYNYFSQSHYTCRKFFFKDPSETPINSIMLIGLIYPDTSIHLCYETMKIQGFLMVKDKKRQKIFNLTVGIALFPFFETCCIFNM